MRASLNKASNSTSTSTSQPQLSAGRYLLFVGVLVAGCSLDLATKSFIFDAYHDPTGVAPPEQHWWIDGWLGIETSVNQGALFGLGQGKSNWFALLSVAALAGILYWLFVLRAAFDRWLTIALGAVSGGILGNLYDRLGLWHGRGEGSYAGVELPKNQLFGVRDWIHFRWEGAPFSFLDPWPNFNIADMLLVCGAASLFIHALFSGTPQRPSDNDEDADKENQDQASSSTADSTSLGNDGKKSASSQQHAARSKNRARRKASSS